ncbi:O-antigen ligase family protein [Candidatus Uhrbacteria bacterium]|nr:O-antigen ligase family protein [Candidatus Uhrbacteria bacterium]
MFIPDGTQLTQAWSFAMGASTVLALLCYTFLAWFRPVVAVGVTLALLPTYLLRFSVGGIPMTFLEAMLLMGSVIILLRWRLADAGTMHGSPFAEPLVPLALAWVGIGVLAALWSPAGASAWGMWKAYFLEPVLWWFALRALRGRLDVVRHMIVPFAMGAMGVAAIAIVQQYTGYGIPAPWADAARRRVTSVFGYPNAVGLFLGPLVPLCVGAWSMHGGEHGSRGWALAWHMIAAMSITLSLVAIFFARSTGAIVAVVVALVSMPLIWWSMRTPARAGRRAMLLMGGVLLVNFFCTVWLPYQRNLERIAHPVVRKLAFGAWSGSVRLAQYRETWELLREHPIRGAGLAGYPTAIIPHHRNTKVEIFQYPHNLLLTIWVEVGLIGLLIFLAMLLHALRLAWSTGPSVLAAGIASAMVVVLVHGLVDVPYFKNDLSVLWWTILALVLLRAQRPVSETPERVD